MGSPSWVVQVSHLERPERPGEFAAGGLIAAGAAHSALEFLPQFFDIGIFGNFAHFRIDIYRNRRENVVGNFHQISASGIGGSNCAAPVPKSLKNNLQQVTRSAVRLGLGVRQIVNAARMAQKQRPERLKITVLHQIEQLGIGL